MEPPAVDSIYYELLGFIISLIACALFSFLETSVAALRLFKLKEMAQATKRYKLLFTTLEETPNRILIAILIAYNLAAVTSAALSSSVMEKIAKMLNLSEGLGFAIGILITTITILIADLIPKSIATRNGDRLFSSTLWMTNITYYICRPLVTFLSRFTDAAARFFTGSSGETAEWATSEKEIQFLIDYINDKGLMERHKTAMLKSIFELGTTIIKEIMVPETDVISINVTSTQEEALELFSRFHFTRIPVYEGNPDNIIGMILQKDFFQIIIKKEDKTIAAITRPIIFIPESTKLLRALKEFREQRIHMAMVINEFGSTVGLVTLEDIIEEIVGEISDEYESVPEKIVSIKPGSWLIDASAELDELSPLLNAEFETEDALTLGGFLIEQFQEIPKKGERLHYKNYTFQIQHATPRRIMQVLVYEDKADQADHAPEKEIE